MDCIITLKDGTVSEVGTYAELIAKEGAFADFIRTYLTERTSSDDEDGLGESKFEVLDAPGAKRQ